MKKIYLIFSIFILLACSSTKQIQYNTSDCTLDDKISGNEKLLDAKPYIKGSGGWTIIENDTCKIRVSSGADGFTKRYHNKKNGIIKLLNYNKNTLKINSSNFYYSIGNLNIGNEYFYNDKGEVIQTIDHNRYDKYPICYKDIIKIATKKMGKNYYIHALSRDSLNINNGLKYIWHVSMSDSISKFPTVISKYYKIDAKTGEILKQGFARQI
ncbi:MAG: PepSY domain-containing protein [Limnohabitans sp.]|nr:PepSY domain-containing protein [Limnohabitans sp.]